MDYLAYANYGVLPKVPYPWYIVDLHYRLSDNRWDCIVHKHIVPTVQNISAYGSTPEEAVQSCIDQIERVA